MKKWITVVFLVIVIFLLAWNILAFFLPSGVKITEVDSGYVVVKNYSDTERKFMVVCECTDGGSPILIGYDKNEEFEFAIGAQESKTIPIAFVDEETGKTKEAVPENVCTIMLD